ncbi:MAG: hypothetical protein KF729_00260 [Sandaracinaceae bacterium]|nr:hypothetical protein [Sandaracinaceae bacterium]
MTRSSLVVVIALAGLGLAAPASAQRVGPEPCAQTAQTADYGALAVGAVVVTHRHRFVGGDPNWDPRMGRFLGRVARVVRLSGVDERGCPGVRLDVDGGRWFWRVRDLSIGAEPPPTPQGPPSSARGPERCGLTEEAAVYGRVHVGGEVVLGRHRPVGGDENWHEDMTPFVGRAARVVRLAGVDEAGCPGVNVDLDGAEWFWRVRDVRVPVGDEPPVAYRPGLASDHGRPDGDDASPSAPDARVPQACASTDETVAWGALEPGRRVILGAHRAVDGERNWVDEMEAYVGRIARIVRLIGVDDQGCGLVEVDIDEGAFYWRARDLRLAEP